MAFTAPEAFTNPAGNVLGAFLEAVLLDGDATAVTTATATDRVIPLASAPTAA